MILFHNHFLLFFLYGFSFSSPTFNSNAALWGNDFSVVRSQPSPIPENTPPHIPDTTRRLSPRESSRREDSGIFPVRMQTALCAVPLLPASRPAPAHGPEQIDSFLPDPAPNRGGALLTL